jgi:MoxR-like ATPase
MPADASNDAQLVTDIETLGGKLAEARASISKRFIGQDLVVDLTLASLLCGGHALLIGLPGLGKTMLVDTLSTVMGLNGNRIQFTPDLKFWKQPLTARGIFVSSKGQYSASF